ncbi:MAG TPA: hypothetical protein VLL98_06130 [Rickettsiales bacterium]|nr:hypothetical protein [Rickettsiales bacterium]
MTEKLKELNNLLNEKIEGNSKSNPQTIVKDEVDEIERKLLEERLFKLEKKAFLYVANNYFNAKCDLATMQRLLRYIERTHERRRSNECMISRTENLLENVVRKNGF